MIAACPSCRTRFRLPAGSLPEPGGRVRCGACGHVWFQAATAAGAAARTAAPSVDDPSPGPRPVTPSPAGEGSVVLIVALAVAAIAIALYVERDALMRLLPGTVAIYDALGLAGAPASEGLDAAG